MSLLQLCPRFACLFHFHSCFGLLVYHLLIWLLFLRQYVRHIPQHFSNLYGVNFRNAFDLYGTGANICLICLLFSSFDNPKIKHTNCSRFTKGVREYFMVLLTKSCSISRYNFNSECFQYYYLLEKRLPGLFRRMKVSSVS